MVYSFCCLSFWIPLIRGELRSLSFNGQFGKLTDRIELRSLSLSKGRTLCAFVTLAALRLLFPCSSVANSSASAFFRVLLLLLLPSVFFRVLPWLMLLLPSMANLFLGLHFYLYSRHSELKLFKILYLFYIYH